MSTSTRWTVVVLAVVVALIGALWLQLQDDDAGPGSGPAAARVAASAAAE